MHQLEVLETTSLPYDGGLKRWAQRRAQKWQDEKTSIPLHEVIRQWGLSYRQSLPARGDAAVPHLKYLIQIDWQPITALIGAA